MLVQLCFLSYRILKVTGSKELHLLRFGLHVPSREISLDTDLSLHTPDASSHVKSQLWQVKAQEASPRRRFAGGNFERTCSQDPCRRLRDREPARGRRLQSRPNRVLRWLLRGAGTALPICPGQGPLVTTSPWSGHTPVNSSHRGQAALGRDTIRRWCPFVLGEAQRAIR